jgi:hypothetical protein
LTAHPMIELQMPHTLFSNHFRLRFIPSEVHLHELIKKSNALEGRTCGASFANIFNYKQLHILSALFSLPTSIRKQCVFCVL